MHTKRCISSLLVLSLCVFSSCYTLNERSGADAGTNIESMVEAELAIAENLLAKGNADKAWENIRPLLTQYPQRADVLTIAGLSLLALQNNQRAYQLLSKAYSLKKTSTAGLNLSSALIALGKYAQAKNLLLQLLEAEEPYNFKERMWHNLALVYDKEGDEEQAIATYKQAIKENPTYYLSHVHLAKIYKRHDRTQDLALEYFSRAHRFCLDCFEPVEELAQMYLEQQRQKDAIHLLQGYLQNEENSSENRQRAQLLLQEAKTHSNDIFPLSLE